MKFEPDLNPKLTLSACLLTLNGGGRAPVQFVDCFDDKFIPPFFISLNVSPLATVLELSYDLATPVAADWGLSSGKFTFYPARGLLLFGSLFMLCSLRGSSFI